jgi:predicted CXXCH cytochrome family protein
MSVEKSLLMAAALAAATAATAAGAGRLAPLPPADAVSTHGPFEMGACEACHEKRAPAPGKLLKASNDLCFDCHDDFKKPVKNHPAAKACTACHSPHNSRKKKLLL